MTTRSHNRSWKARVTCAALAAFVASGCAAAPRAKPLPTSKIDTSLEEARKFLQGRWNLVSYEIFPPGKAPIQIQGQSGNGTLVYDDFGNLDIQIRVTDRAVSDALTGAGVPLNNGVISTTGRTAIDLQQKTITYILQGQNPLVSTTPGPLAMDRPRYWEVQGNNLILTTKGNDGKPVAIGKWQKAAP